MWPQILACVSTGEKFFCALTPGGRSKNPRKSHFEGSLCYHASHKKDDLAPKRGTFAGLNPGWEVSTAVTRLPHNFG
jgi:hypothetical protein